MDAFYKTLTFSRNCYTFYQKKTTYFSILWHRIVACWEWLSCCALHWNKLRILCELQQLTAAAEAAPVATFNAIRLTTSNFISWEFVKTKQVKFDALKTTGMSFCVVCVHICVYKEKLSSFIKSDLIRFRTFNVSYLISQLDSIRSIQNITNCLFR